MPGGEPVTDPVDRPHWAGHSATGVQQRQRLSSDTGQAACCRRCGTWAIAPL